MTNTPTVYPELAGKVVVVTGGSGLIGGSTSRLLDANGMQVAANGRDQAKIDAMVSSIQSAGGQAISALADCTKFEAVQRMQMRVEDKLGAVDALVVFAGGPGKPTPTGQIGEQEWHAIINANLTATFLTVKSFLPDMIHRQRGVIVTMASSSGRLPGGSSSAYAAAKAGVVMFTRHVADEVGKHGIRVNCIAPALIASEETQTSTTEVSLRTTVATYALGRLGYPQRYCGRYFIPGFRRASR